MAARSADEGLTMAQRARPDLVIADAVMPERSGYDLCAAIKSDPALRGVPVFILTSTHNPYDEARARQVAADGHFVEAVRLADAGGQRGGGGRTGARASLAGAPRAVGRRHAGRGRRLRRDLGRWLGRASGRDVPRRERGRRPGHAAAGSPGGAAAARPVAARPGGSAPGMRPSLIPGHAARASRRPGRGRPPGPRGPGIPGAAAPMRRLSPRAPVPHAAPPHVRTAMGLPAAESPGARPAGPFTAMPAAVPSTIGAQFRRDGRAHAAPLRRRSAWPPRPPRRSRAGWPRRWRAISARGPEYEAIASLSREIIEKIAWEIVPELAEAIVREELQKRGRI